MFLSLSLVHMGVPTLSNVRTSCEASSECLLSGSAARLFDFDLALCLVVNGHTSNQTCAQGSTGVHVWWSLLALILSCASRTFGITFSAASHDEKQSCLCLHFDFCPS